MMNIQSTATGHEAKPERSNQHAASGWKPLLVFVLFTLGITVSGYYIFQHYTDSIQSERQDELGGIAELKIRLISTWMDERRGNAQALKNSPLFQAEVEHWLQQGGPAGESKTKLIGLLSSLQQAYAAYGYTSISLFDEQGMLRLSSAADEVPIKGVEKTHLLEIMHSGEIAFSEIHREKTRSGERVEIELSVPLTMIRNGKTHAVAAIIFRIDPYRFLFPLIQRWPTASPSAETLLVRRDGDEVIFLNELRHRKNTALSMRLPLSNRALPAAMATLGQVGLVEGYDYRGVAVVGVLSKIPGTSWAMVSKIDKAEIYAPISHLRNWLILLMLSMVGVGGGITLFWRNKEQQQYESELKRQALVLHLDYLAKYANDIILLLDETGKIVDFNDRAVAAYGYSDAEFKSLNIDDLRAINFSLPAAERLRQIGQAGGALMFESMHVRRNRTRFPIEASVRQINIAEEKFYQCIIRDITERKQAENELILQRNLIRQIIDSDPNFIFVKDADGRFLLANEALAKSYGLTIDEIIGKCSAEFIHNPEHAAAYDSSNRKVLEDLKEQVALEQGVPIDGKTHWFQTIRKPLQQGDGSLSVLTIATDVTELKDAEEKLKRLNRSLRLLSSCNLALVHTGEEQRLLAEICKLIVETGGYKMAWVGFAEHDPEKTVRPVMQYGIDEGYLERAHISWADTELGRGPTGTAIRTGITQVCQNFISNPLAAPWRDEALARGYQANIALPLKIGSRTLGALILYSSEPNAFSSEEVELLEELAGDLAWGISALRMRTEYEHAVEKLRQSEEHFRFLTENATDMVFLMSPQSGQYVYVSPASTRLLGYTPEECCNSLMLISSIVHPDSYDYFDEQWKNMQSGKFPPYLEYQIIHKSGETRWIHQRYAPSGRDIAISAPTSIQGVLTDITERKLAEAQLENERIRLRTLVQTIPDLVWLKDMNGVYLSCNPQIERLYGAKEMEIVGKTDYDFAEAELAAHFRQKDQEAMAAGKPSVNEEWVTYPDNGQRALLETIKTPMRDEAGKLVGVMGIARDITERKQAEQRESRLRHTLDNTRDMIFMFRPDSLRFVYVNKGAIDIIGYSNEELLQMSPPDINPLLPEPQFRKLVAPLISGEKELLRFETIQQNKNGADLDVEVQLQLVPEPEGNSMFVSIVRDITERKQAEKELQRQKTFMWQVIDTDPNRIFVKDIKGKFLLVNQSTAAAHGLTPNEMVGRSMAEINHSSEEVAGYLAADRKVIEDGDEISLIEPYTLPNGERRWLLTFKKRLTMPNGSLSVLGIAVDITQQKLSEIKLADSYKELQRLSLHLENIRADERAKIALNLHDEMGATLAALKMRVAWLASKLPAELPVLAAEAAQINELVSGGIHTMHHIVKQLRPNLLGDVGLVAAIKDYVKQFLEHTGIECILALPDKEFVLDADQSLTFFRILQESLNNVVKHAQASRVSILFTEQDKSLMMEIKDNGIGFDPVVHKEFSLGLLGIRERALMVGGNAKISSKPGKGVCVSVILPCFNYQD